VLQLWLLWESCGCRAYRLGSADSGENIGKLPELLKPPVQPQASNTALIFSASAGVTGVSARSAEVPAMIPVTANAIAIRMNFISMLLCECLATAKRLMRSNVALSLRPMHSATWTFRVSNRIQCPKLPPILAAVAGAAADRAEPNACCQASSDTESEADRPLHAVDRPGGEGPVRFASHVR
jgi:hypothetical protein